MVWFSLFSNFIWMEIRLYVFFHFMSLFNVIWESFVLQIAASIFIVIWSSFVLISQSIHSVEEHLAYFQFWIITSNSALNILAYIILVYTYMSFSRTRVVIEALSYKLYTSSAVVDNARLFSKAAILVYTPPSSPEVYETSHYYTSLPILGIIKLFNSCQSGGCVVLSLCAFSLHLPHYS